MKLRMVIADDHPLVLAGVRAALEQHDDIEIVGAAGTGARALTLVGRERPDVALVDLDMPDLPGLQLLTLIRERHPEVTVVMLSGSRDANDIARATAAGAAAYIDKRIQLEDIAAIVRQVHNGTLHRPVAPSETVDGLSDAGLTSRERDVLGVMLLGRSNKAISAELWVTEKTVKFHLGNIYRKLGVSTRAEAQRLAYERGVAAAR
jgi:DNA-binding NarL/FixJ family response regulator